MLQLTSRVFFNFILLDIRHVISNVLSFFKIFNTLEKYDMLSFSSKILPLLHVIYNPNHAIVMSNDLH